MRDLESRSYWAAKRKKRLSRLLLTAAALLFAAGLAIGATL